MGLGKNKVLLPLEGIPILIRSIKAFTVHPWIKEIIIAARAEDWEEIRAMLELWQIKDVKLAIGGQRRQDSVAAGLAALSSGVGWVFVHDAARPLIDHQ